MHVDPNTLHDFWKQALMNFDKSFGNSEVDPFKVIQKVGILCIVERESDRRLGVLIYMKDSSDRYVVHRDPSGKIHIVTVTHISNRWKILDLDFGSLEYFIGKPATELIRSLEGDRMWESCYREYANAPPDIKKISINPLGRLLEELVFSSKSLRDCLKSFGKDSGGDGMLSFIVLQIPVVGGTFFTVMEFYGLGKILKSKHVSKNDKIEEVVKKVSKVGITMGTVFSTSMIGQIIIPIPVVGMLIGGLVGGVISSFVGKAIDSSNNYPVMKFSVFIDTLMKLRQPDGAWVFDQVQGVKHILARWFTLTKPSEAALPDLDKTWLTVICFVNISLYHTILSQKEDLPDEEVERLEEINSWLDLTISYLADNFDIIGQESKVSKVAETLGVLTKEGYLVIDIQTKK